VGALCSTKVDETTARPLECDISNVCVDFSFGSNGSSTEAHLNEAMDRSEACASFENPDQATQDLLNDACEKSRHAIDL